MRTLVWDTAPMVGMPFESAAEDAAAAALTDVVEINCRGRGGNLVFEVENKSAIALQDFALLVKAHENGDWHTLVSSTDWSAVTASAPNTLAAATHAMVSMSIAPCWSIKFQARASGSTIVAAVVVRGTVNEAGGSSGGGSGSDAELGAVEIKDATTNARAKVGAGNVLGSTDVAVAVRDANAPTAAAVAAAIAPTVTVGAIGAQTITQNTSTQVRAADTARERVILTNNSDTVMYVGVGTAAVASQGITLAVSGVVILTPSGGCKLAINAICAGSGKALSYQTTSTA
jgi:hypothetical protein